MEEKQGRVILAELSLLVLAMIWGGTFVAAKIALEGFDPYWIMALRFALGSGLLFLLRPGDCLKVDAYTLRAGGEVGLLLGLGVAFQMIGLQYTTPAQQSFIVVTYVITVPLMEWFLDKKYPGNLTLISAILAFMGVGFLSLKKGFAIQLGDFLTLVYALLLAFQMIRVGRHANQVSSAIGFTFIQLLAAGAISLALALGKSQTFFVGQPGWPSWAALIYLALLNTALAYVLQNFGQKYARPSNVALILSTEVLFGALAAYFITQENFTPKKIIGCVLIFTAILISQVGQKALKAKQDPKGPGSAGLDG
ncbi:MAG: DMT family transporter [Tissierellia bacterium]|nr:DMT family transporter [Tissierellia bacterium]